MVILMHAQLDNHSVFEAAELETEVPEVGAIFVNRECGCCMLLIYFPRLLSLIYSR